MNKILLIRLRKLGDIVFTLPSVDLLRKAFPEAEIDYLLEPEYKGLFELFPPLRINEITVQRKLSLRENLRFLKKLRSENYDITIDFHGGPRAALFCFAGRAARRIGYSTPNRNWAYHLRFPRYHQPPLHSVYNQLQLVAPLGISVPSEVNYPLPDQTRLDNEFFSFFDLKQPYCLIHLGAGNRFRDWGEKNFSCLIESLRQKKIHTLLVGEHEWERDRAKKFSDRKIIFDLTGRLSYARFLVLVSRAKVFFGADSGPLHLASLTETPLVALYGPNVAEISGPFRKENVFLLEKNLSCRPCDQRSCVYEQPRCLQTIEVNDVLDKIVFCFQR